MEDADIFAKKKADAKAIFTTVTRGPEIDGTYGLLFIFYPLLEFKIKNDGLTFAVLLIASHFIAKTLSSPAGVWSDHSKKSAVKKKDFEQ
ncbi:hypothetical protein ABHN11_11625 [Brevibacillus centrosporus]|uniref:hypothetical protein n=1 Tax=Brevibacillus centrosporus TaxID=54910 RepID=UPI003D241F40